MRDSHLPFLVLAISGALACTNGAQAPTTAEAPAPARGCAPTLVHDRDWYTSGKTQRFFAGLDGLHYAISISKDLPAARRDSIQRYCDEGLVLAYGFNHAEAARSFWQATRLDSTCAMAWWGFAYVLGPNYNAGMEPDNYERAHAAITRAQALKGTCTPKEQGLIDAMALRYTATPVEDRAPLDKAYSNALRTLASTYPDDADIAAFFAESLMDQHPWDLWEKNGNERPWTPEIIAALERSMKTFPDHFGAHHLYIHAVEASRTPERALPSAAFLADAVPGSGHLTHMPSHIYIRTGRYHEGVVANQRSVTVDSGYTAKCHAAGIYPIAYFPHNIHFVSACATFTGQKKLAWNSALDLRAHLAGDLMHAPDFATLQHYHAFPWMVAVKLGLWPELTAEAAPDSTLPYALALWHYAQGVRRARTGDAPGARAELAALQHLMRDSVVATMTIWGINRAAHILRIAEHELLGEVSSAEGQREDAVGHFTRAVAAEDSLQYQEPPDWTFPARHELGAALLRAGNAPQAEKVFNEDLVYWPENGYALQGLREALFVQNKNGAAQKLDTRIDAAWEHAEH
jgi:tetratricopeptide (TPR) repeat protein